MSNKALSEPTYIERAAQMTAQERAALKVVLAEKFAEFKQLAKASQFAAVRGVNVAREMGEQIELFTGHEKLLPAEFQTLAPVLSDASLEFAKLCLALRHKFPAPVTEYTQAAPEWEHLLVQLELLPAPERGRAQSTALHEPVKDFISGVIKVAQSSVALAREMPVEKWPEFYLTTFVRESQQIHDLHDRAKELLNRNS